MTAIAQGAAGTVYEHPSRRDLVVKIYTTPADCEELRIKWLCANPPSLMWDKRRPRFGWPLEPVYDARTGDMIGFVMPRATGCVEVQAIVDPSTRIPSISRDWLRNVAISFLSRLHSLHLQNYIVGDINFRNILVSRRAVVTLIDVDSFHFTIPNGGPTFSTMGFRPELQPPELVEAVPPVYDRDYDQDAFSAYVVVYRLLCQGVHPFSCQYLGQGDMPLPQELLQQAIWPDALKHPLYRPAPCKYPLASLPPAMQQLFRQMFDEGLTDRTKRPNVTELLTCLQQRRSIGSTLRSRVGHVAWSRQQKCGNRARDLAYLRNGARLLRRHKGKVALAAVTALGIGAAFKPDEAQQTTQPRFSSLRSRQTRQTPMLGLRDRVSDPAHVELTEPGLKLLPTPKLWQRANETTRLPRNG